MKCLVCPSEIDENQPVEPTDSVSARQQRASELSNWSQVVMTTTRNGGQHVLFQGNLCPIHCGSDDFALSIKKGK